MPVPTSVPTGRRNMLASVRLYMDQYLPKRFVDGRTYKVKFEQYMESSEFPCICIQDFGTPTLGGHAFDDYMGQDTNGFKVFGKRAQTMLVMTCQTNESEVDTAVKDLYDMADQLEFLWQYSSIGQADEFGNRIMPRMALLDFDTNPPTDTGATVSAPMEKDSVWIPNYIGTDPERPQIRMFQVRLRVEWQWLRP